MTFALQLSLCFGLEGNFAACYYFEYFRGLQTAHTMFKFKCKAFSSGAALRSCLEVHNCSISMIWNNKGRCVMTLFPAYGVQC